MAVLVHRGRDKMIQDMKRYFWWKGLKQDMPQHVSEYLKLPKSEV